MPAYTTQTELTERYGAALLVSLTDRGDTATGLIDASVVTRAISEAEGLINGYVKGRYALPFATVPDPIPAIAQQIAIYTLHPFEPDAKIVRDYEAAIRQLREIAQGVIELDAEGATPAQTGASGVEVTDRERPFTESNLKGFI
jgi:phage gp36-like protein